MGMASAATWHYEAADHPLMADKKVKWTLVAQKIGCSHAYYLSWAKKCEGCRKTPLSPRLAYLEETYNREG